MDFSHSNYAKISINWNLPVEGKIADSNLFDSYSRIENVNFTKNNPNQLVTFLKCLKN